MTLQYKIFCIYSSAKVSLNPLSKTSIYNHKMNKNESKCHICKKRFRNEEIDYCCDSCEEDLSDSERKRDVVLRKKKKIRKKEEGKEDKTMKIYKKSPSSSTSEEMVGQFNDNMYIEERRLLSSEQYDYFVYLTLNNDTLTEQEKYRLSEINAQACRYHTQSQNKVLNKCYNLGYEQQQVLSLIHYIEIEAPIVIYFNINKEIGEFSRDPLVFTHDRVTLNGIVGQIIIGSDIKRRNDHKCYGQSYLILKENVRKRCFAKGQTQRNSVPYTNLTYNQHMLAGLPIDELKKSIGSLYSQQEGLQKEIFIMGKIMLNKHVEKICVSSKEARGDYEGMLSQIQSKYGVDFSIF